jgi:hypothetical protein
MQSFETREAKFARGDVLGIEEFVCWQYARTGIGLADAWDATRLAFSQARVAHKDLAAHSQEMNFIACGLSS